MTVLCWDCKNTFEVATDMEGKAYQRGDIKRFREGDQESPWMGLCSRCKELHARAEDPKALPFRPRSKALTIQTIHDDTNRIMLAAEALIEFNPELSREEAIHRAVELHFAPEHEPDAGFREFLLQRDRPPLPLD